MLGRQASQRTVGVFAAALAAILLPMGLGDPADAHSDVAPVGTANDFVIPSERVKTSAFNTATSTNGPGTYEVVVAAVDAPNAQGVTAESPANAQTSQATIEAVDDFYNVATGGAYRMSLRAVIDLVSAEPICDIYKARSTALDPVKAALGGSLEPSPGSGAVGTILLIVTPNQTYEGCAPYAGVAFLGIGLGHINGAWGVGNAGVVEHEMGHMFGLQHANTLDCWPNDAIPGTALTVTYPCTSREYADPTDAMGSAAAPGFGAANLLELRALSSADVLSLEGSQDFTLVPLSGTADGNRLAIYIDASGRQWSVEFRPTPGPFPPFTSWWQNSGSAGVHLKLVTRTGAFGGVFGGPNGGDTHAMSFGQYGWQEVGKTGLTAGTEVNLADGSVLKVLSTSESGAQLRLTVQRQMQMLQLPNIPAQVDIDALVIFAPYASSALQVEKTSLTPTVCTVSGSMVSLLSPGTCTLRATQGGSAHWEPVAATVSFVITGQGRPTPPPATPSPSPSNPSPVPVPPGSNPPANPGNSSPNPGWPSPSTAPEWVAAPDLSIKAAAGGKYLGAGVRNNSGKKQTVAKSVRAKAKQRFTVRVNNPGAAGVVVLTGKGNQGGMRAAYKLGGANITAALTGGGYHLNLPAGSSVTIALTVTAKRKPKSAVTWPVKATGSSATDVVKATAR